MHQGFSTHLTYFGADQIIQQRLAGEQLIDVVILIMGGGQAVPAPFVGLGHEVHGRFPFLLR
jgi:hypothetical protein